MKSKDKLIIQAKSMAIYYFLNDYNSVEKLLLQLYSKRFKLASEENKKLMCFFMGSKVKPYIDVSSKSIMMQNINIDLDMKLTSFTLNELLKIDDKLKVIPELDEEIELQKNTSMKTRDCIKCFMGMRNRLAHEMENVRFKTGDIVELLSKDKLNTTKEDFDFSQYKEIMDDVTQEILSNVVYQERILHKIEMLENTF